MDSPETMQSFYLNTFDMIVLGVVAVSAIFAFFRGFLKEMLSLFAWVAASIIAFKYAGPLAESFSDQITNKIAAQGLAAGGLFFFSLVAISIFNSLLVKRFQEGSIGALDRSLGFTFGLARGALLVSFAYLVLLMVTPAEDPPNWMEEAKTRRLLEIGAGGIRSLAPEYFENIEGMAEEGRPEKKKKDVTEPSLEPKEDMGYDRRHLQQLERLIDQAQ